MISRRIVAGTVGALLTNPRLALAEADAESAEPNWFAPRPALRRLLRPRSGEAVPVSEYVIGDGRADDTEAYQTLMDLAADEYVYSDGLTIALTSTVQWRGHRVHRFGRNARLVGDVEGFAVRGLGFPELLSTALAEPAGRGAVSFRVDQPGELTVGDDFYLFDAASDEYDVNRVRATNGPEIETARPLNYDFTSPQTVRLYTLRNAVRDVTVLGGEVRNVNSSEAAHGLGFLNAVDIRVDGLSVVETGGIGLSFDASMRWQAHRVAAIRTGASGLGGRSVKDFSVTGFRSRWPRRDESLTFYRNCTHGLIEDADITQFLSGETDARAGNCILLDDRCCDIEVRRPRLRGSATYALFINNRSDRNLVVDPDIAGANLGGVRIARNSNHNRITGGRIAHVVNARDNEQQLIATAAIQDDSTCTGNVLGEGTRFEGIASGVHIRLEGKRAHR